MAPSAVKRVQPQSSAVNRSQPQSNVVKRSQSGTAWPRSARLNIGLKSVETPVITGLQALSLNISTGSFEPVENRLSRGLKPLV